ncbi:MAG: LuxR C-terminal-related transcriptional regulator [Elusimicrobiota bacterium]|nr:LuxR C-terminal-related transcriptional regulator [Elusimicrobiota bacterium]
MKSGVSSYPNLPEKSLTTKEIAGLLSASSRTITRHRNNIRKKLGLANKGVNLVSYL